MAIPTASDVRTYLEGYCIDETILSNTWIDNRMNKSVVPFVERIIKRKVEGVEEVTEYLSGNGASILILSRKDVNSLVSIEYVTGSDDTVDSFIGLAGVRLIGDQGIIKSISNITEGGYGTIFARGKRNLKIVYNIGSSTIEEDIKEALLMLCAEKVLGFVGARTGGGSISVQGFSRNFGERGKYQDVRNDLKRDAMALLKNYMTTVVGSIK